MFVLLIGHSVGVNVPYLGFMINFMVLSFLLVVTCDF